MYSYCYTPDQEESETYHDVLLPILPTPKKASVTGTFKLKVAFYFCSEGVKAKTTNKIIHLPTFPIKKQKY